MASKPPSVNIIAADESYHRLVQEALDQVTASPPRWQAAAAQLVLDFPLTWAMTRMTDMNSVERAKTVVVTQGSHPAYLDMLASHHVSGVVEVGDMRMLVAGIYAAASSLKTYQWRSGLTYMELRVTRLLLQGLDTAASADHLRVAQKTVNAHVSNILSKLGLESRTQYLAALVAHHPAVP
ncbi:MAG: helix-turn-helix transcriptional regulator [Trueperaceae bacterium]|nr:helix-turn-helix transcriptional regulator [Trueperaceae bacterium]MCO5172773.1 helix-turn-helix transcriptional regulator [Trueperaceae bacterium]MCW5820676.1 helix-turn-helix transcriptional regulator [Trueperaceae bacterium]